MWKSSVWSSKATQLAVVAISAWSLVNPVFSGELTNDREIHLKGTSNTRDIGGYQTNDLRTLRTGQIIRSENLSRLTAKDFQKLEDIGIKTVIDLRTDKEHDEKPTVWVGDNPPEFYHLPIGDARNDWFKTQHRMMKSNKFTEEQALEHMVNGYHMIAEEGPASYQKLVELVLDQSNWPVLIHCNAGKDRSGIAVMMLMEALGVDRETIMEEFLLTNKMSRAKEKAEFLAQERKYSRTGRKLGKAPSAGAWFQIIGVQAVMLEAFYARVDEQYGSMDAFLTEMGLDRDARWALTESLTTEQPKMAMGQ